MVATIIEIDDEQKNIAGQVLKYNLQNRMKNWELMYLTNRSIEQTQPKRQIQK